MEIERHPDTPIKVSDTAARTGHVPFFIAFRARLTDTPRYEKVKMPTMDLYDGTTDPEEHLGAYKV